MSCELWAKAHGSRLKAHSIKMKKYEKDNISNSIIRCCQRKRTE